MTEQGKKMKPQTYILKTIGVTITGTMSPAGQWVCTWNPPPPYTPEIGRQILRDYEPWRNAAFADYARKTGKRILILS